MFQLKLRTVFILSGTVVFSLLLLLQAFPLQSHSNDYALVAGDHGTLYSFDGKTLFSIPTSTTQNLTSVKWRHDSSYALIVGSGGTVLKYDGSLTVIPSGAGSSVNFESVSWSPDDSQALIVGIDRSARRADGAVFRFDGHQVARVFTEKYGGFYSVDWNPDGSYALVVGFSTQGFIHGEIAKFDGHALNIIPAHTNDSLNGVAWSPDGKYALIGGGIHGLTLNTTLLQYNDVSTLPLDTGKCCFTNDAHTTRTISFSQDSQIGLVNGNRGLVIAYDYGANPVRTRDFVNFQNKLEDLHHIGDFYSSAFVPGTHVAYAVGGNSTVARISSMNVVLIDQTLGTPNLRSVSITTRREGMSGIGPLYINPPKTNVEQAVQVISSVQQPVLLLAFLSMIPIVLIIGSRGKETRSQDLGLELDPIIRTIKVTPAPEKVVWEVSATKLGFLRDAVSLKRLGSTLGEITPTLARMSHQIRSGLSITKVHGFHRHASVREPSLQETYSNVNLWPQNRRSEIMPEAFVKTNHILGRITGHFHHQRSDVNLIDQAPRRRETSRPTPVSSTDQQHTVRRPSN